ncbi:MAG: MaoC family dehydratase N-terminal domain-containing protein [Deltaproteobacteria bacterium]|nr:MaoC family dehydratase N-terminal domain-containing protein [Deltaproteobacteria bacterium]
MSDKTWEDFQVGERVFSIRLTITEAHLVQWAHLTLDFYPLHMDETFARKAEFGRRIAHGPLIFSLGVGMMTSTGFYGDSVMAWLGVENMRIPGPVFIGDTIQTRGTVLKKGESRKPDRGLITMGYEIFNQNEATVMAYEPIFLVRRKER